MLHFGVNEFLVNMKTLLIGLYFGKILGDIGFDPSPVGISLVDTRS